MIPMYYLLVSVGQRSGPAAKGLRVTVHVLAGQRVHLQLRVLAKLIWAVDRI